MMEGQGQRDRSKRQFSPKEESLSVVLVKSTPMWRDTVDVDNGHGATLGRQNHGVSHKPAWYKFGIGICNKPIANELDHIMESSIMFLCYAFSGHWHREEYFFFQGCSSDLEPDKLFALIALRSKIQGIAHQIRLPCQYGQQPEWQLLLEPGWWWWWWWWWWYNCTSQSSMDRCWDGDGKAMPSDFECWRSESSRQGRDSQVGWPAAQCWCATILVC